MNKIDKDIFTELLDDSFSKSLIDNFKSFVEKFKNIDRWALFSDYCIGDKNKPNNIISFVLIPFYSNDNFLNAEKKNCSSVKELQEIVKIFQSNKIRI